MWKYLFLGVNMPDHNNILKSLEKILKSKKNYTALLEPRKCHNFSSIVQCIDNELQNQLCEVLRLLQYLQYFIINVFLSMQNIYCSLIQNYFKNVGENGNEWANL